MGATAPSRFYTPGAAPLSAGRVCARLQICPASFPVTGWNAEKPSNLRKFRETLGEPALASRAGRRASDNGAAAQRPSVRA